MLERNGRIGTPEDIPIIYALMASVLAAAVWGDYCSPLADITLLPTMASGCDLLEYARTQLPYAMLVGVVSLIFGDLAVSYSVSWWPGMVVGVSVLLVAGKRPERQTETDPTPPKAPEKALN